MNSFRFVAQSPSGVSEPSVAIAANRTGSLGSVDITGFTHWQAKALIRKVLKFSDQPFALRIGGNDSKLLPTLLSDLPSQCSILILPDSVSASLVKRIKKIGRAVWLELSDVALGQRTIKPGVDALIVAASSLYSAESPSSTQPNLEQLVNDFALPIYLSNLKSTEQILAARTAGAAGVILTDHLLLLSEASLAPQQRAEALQNEIAVQTAKQHKSVSGLLSALQAAIDTQAEVAVVTTATKQAKPTNVAIIGIECVLPQAQNRNAYWENIVNAVSAIGEVPTERWPSELYFDADKDARDKLYSRWGGFIDEIAFDPLEFGMPPNSLRSIDPMQLLALHVAKEALGDAGYAEAQHGETGIILGCSGGLGDVGSYYLARTMLPLMVGDASAEILDNLDHVPEWSEDSFAGLLPNVAAGRIANRMDFGGVNFVVDAACGSSLAAVHLAVRELVNESADMMVVGGVDTIQSPFGFMCFSKTTALSPQGVPRVFDEQGDGIVISEGVVMLVLKRLADAERDGDRIYAVIQGSAGSSDGKALGMTAPRAEGQMLALDRVYSGSGIDPKTVGLFEAHGTGTPVGDRTEAQSLGRFLDEHGGQPNRFPIGSVKSMIGHTKAAAGVAGLAKIALALHHKILPPTINVEKPNPKSNFGTGPLYVNSETRPWIHGAEHPRRAAVSAFGFGGTNFHILAEEYRGNFWGEGAPVQQRSSELFVFSGKDSAEITARLHTIGNAVNQGAQPKLADLAYTVWQEFDHSHPQQLAIVAASFDDLSSKLNTAQQSAQDANGIFWRNADNNGELAFLFPGQGSQYPNMLRDLALHFSEVREAFELSDRVLADKFDRPLSLYVFPPPAFDKATRNVQQAALTATNVAQPALGSADFGAFRLLQAFGVQPDMAAGHSYGEYVALAAAGVIDETTLAQLSEARGRSIVESGGSGLGTMAAVASDAQTIEPLLKELSDVWLANLNAPEQTVISGSEQGISKAAAKLEEAGLQVRPIAVSAAFHSPIISAAQKRFDEHLEAVDFAKPTFDVYSNTTAKPYKGRSKTIAKQLKRHMTATVRFVEQVEAMYEAGARVFVECGPRSVLSNLVGKILGERPFVTITLDHPKKEGVTELHTALAKLLANGVKVNLDRLFAGRDVRTLDLEQLWEDTQPQPLRATTWMVSGGAARPLNEPRKVVSAESLNQAFAVAMQRPITQVPEPKKIVQGKSTIPSSQPTAQPIVAPPSIVQSYHELMTHFLHTQQEIMTSAMRGGERQQPLPKSSVTTQAARPTAAVQSERLVLERKSERPINSTVKSVPRSLLQWKAVALPEADTYFGERAFSAESPILITDDGRGIAQLLAEQIRIAGGAPVIAARGYDDKQWAGVLHLAPLHDEQGIALDDAATSQKMAAQAVKPLLGLARSLLGNAPFLLAAIASETNPQHGGVSGFMKTAAQELDDVRVQCVDVDWEASAEIIADQIWQELIGSAPQPIIRYREGQRLAVQQVAAPISTSVPTTQITQDDVIVVTGGARGITAQVALVIAQQFQPTLVLVGRSELSDSAEADSTRGITDPKQLKAAIIADMRQGGAKVSLKEVEQRFNQLLKMREMQSNIAAIKATGATVRYHAADVRDASALANVFVTTRTEFGKISGVIHGAGIIEDKLIVDKSAESFDRVFGTKVDSLFNLIQLINPVHLKFMALFSSAAGAFGNRGQCDYAAANDLMNQIASYLDKQWDAHVVACCWGPWATDGMVSPELERQFKAMGIELIEIEAGCKALIDEVQYGTEPVVIYAGGAWSGGSEQLTAKNHATRNTQHAFEFASYDLPLMTQVGVERNGTTFAVRRRFTVEGDRYLDHHRLDGTPVLPMAVATEWMCEVVASGWPTMQIVSVQKLLVQAGVKFERDMPRTLIVEAVGDDEALSQQIAVALSDADSGRTLYRTTVELAKKLPKARQHEVPQDLDYFECNVAECYEKWLFHGSVFQTIHQIVGIGKTDLVMEISGSSAETAIPNSTGNWLIDPIMFDAGLQGALIWARQQLDVTPIPLGFDKLERFHHADTTVKKVHLQFVRDDDSQSLHINSAFLNASNNVLISIEGVHGQYSSAFNRLGGHEQYAPLIVEAA